MKKPILKHQSGFSLAELTVTLVIFGAIVLVTTKITNNIFQKKQNMARADLMKSYETTALKYTNDQYDSIVKSLTGTSSNYIVNYNQVLSAYSQTGTTTNWASNASFFKEPCLIYQNDAVTKKINAYFLLLFKNNMNVSSTAFNDILHSFNSNNINIIQKNSGSDAIILSGNSELFKIKAPVYSACNAFKDFSNSNQKSNFKGFLINISKNSSFVNKLSTISDGVNNSQGKQEALLTGTNASTNDKTLYSNMYLDAIVKESSAWSNNYCDATKANITKLTNQCQTYANANGLQFNGLQQVSSITKIGNTCQILAKANFSSRDTCAVPPTTAQNSALTICQNYHPSGYNYVDSLAYSSYTPSPTGGICSANFKGRYGYTTTNPSTYSYKIISSTYNGQSTYENVETTGTANAGQVVSINKSCSICEYGTCNYVVFNFASTTGAGNVNPISGTSSGRQPQSGCVSFIPNQFTLQTKIRYEETQTGGGSSTVYNNFQCANNIQYSADFGASTQMNCGGAYNDSDAYVTTSGVNPPEHKFKALNLNNAGSATIQIKSNSNDGVASTDSTLLINNAGIKSGYIAPKQRVNNPIAADSSCTPAELGKMTQQVDYSSIYNTSLVVCTYSPDFCGGTGYCYAPLKSQTQTVMQSPYVSSAYCPAGTFADPTQINTSNIANYTTIIFCGVGRSQKYEMITDGGKLIGFKSYCQDAYNNAYPNNNITAISCLSSANLHTGSGCKGGVDGKVTCTGVN